MDAPTYLASPDVILGDELLILLSPDHVQRLTRPARGH
jgi:hypothetical protein